MSIVVERVGIGNALVRGPQKMFFYIGLGLQLIGFAAVGLCLFSGIDKGNYGQMEFLQLVGGSALFYIGTFVKGRTSLQ